MARDDSLSFQSFVMTSIGYGVAKDIAQILMDAGIRTPMAVEYGCSGNFHINPNIPDGEFASRGAGSKQRRLGMPLKVFTILETRDSFALSLAKSSLEEAGIPYLVDADDPKYLPGVHGTSGIGETPLWKCMCRIQVSPELEQSARAILDPLQNPITEDEPDHFATDDRGP